MVTKALNGTVVRVEFTMLGKMESPIHDDQILEKIAFLRMCDIGKSIPTVGQRKLRNVFYIYYDYGEIQ